ncbi:insulinase family protein [Aliikangiella coralliicola]|uniref:Protease 3 n=1 Tax=Aliikangiella coralliicola TaxID=2592383 RepID=A0A545UIE3_9GAMM|nr:insulinase family protein [Aliikangiella coralliicola]TQV89203.1 hypothetical protein FLL46_03490 [Aliikangiella coralliicola]
MRVFRCLLFIFFVSTSACGAKATASAKSEVELKATFPGKISIIKGDADPADYQLITLENGIKVLLVSDSRAKLATASLSVAAGYFHDPNNMAGVAHLLEHMISKGSARYPGVSTYRDFIGKVGGGANASTSREVTNYYFYVPELAFEQALDRFSAQFESPVLSKETMYKERQVVDAEFRLKYQDSYRRNREVIRLTVSKKHPFRKFSTGNIQSLQDTKNATLHQTLKDFYHQYYGSENMVLALHSAKTVEEMSQLAKRYFSQIKNKGKLTKVNTIIPTTKKHQNVLIKIQPNANQQRLTMNFIVPSSAAPKKSSVAGFFTWLFDSNQPGSLQYYLRSKALIWSLKSSTEPVDEHYDFFNIEFRLTQAGLQSTDKILTATYSYLTTIQSKGLKLRQFSIFKQMKDKQFHTTEEVLSGEKIRNLSRRLLRANPPQFFTSQDHISSFDKMSSMNFIDALSPENLRVIIHAKQFEPGKIENYYGTRYEIKPLKWQFKEALDYQFRLPDKSPYLTELVEDSGEEYFRKAKLIQSSKFVRRYFPSMRPGSQFSAITLFVDSALANRTDKNRVLNHLWVTRLDEQLRELQQLAEWALIDLYVNTTPSGFHVTMTSPDELSEQILESVLQEILFPSLSPNKMLSTFQHQKLQYKTQKNMRVKDILQQQQNEILRVVPRKQFAYHFLDQVSQENYRKFLKRYLSKARVTSVFYGNISAGKFKKMNIQIRKKLVNKIRTPWYRKPTSPQWPESSLTSEVETEHQDSAVSIALTSKNHNVDSEAKIRLLSSLIKAPFFRQFRTENPLGYSVSVNHKTVLNESYLHFFIQSPDTDIHQLFGEISRFKKNYLNQLKQLKTDEFETIKQLVSTRYSARALNEAQAFEIVKLNFRSGKPLDYEAKVFAALKQITVNELYRYAKALFENTDTVSLQIAASQ